jgi:hypothetical protein
MSDDLDGIVKPGPVPLWEMDGIRGFRDEDFEEPVRARRRELRAQMETEEFRRRLAEAAAYPGWEYALANQPLPKNADGAIVRDQDKTVKRLLVFHSKRLNDRLISLARVVLAYVESQTPTIAERQIALIWNDERAELDGKEILLGTVSVDERGESAIFRKMSGRAENIPGIGPVRVMGGVS